MSNQGRCMPSKNAIKKYWDGKIGFIEDFGWSELPIDKCWKCSLPADVDRAHIWSRFNSGNDDVSNIHLLCLSCHKQSEFSYGFKPGLLYYEWFYSPNSGVQWLSELMRIWKSYFCEHDIDWAGELTDDESELLRSSFMKWYSEMIESGHETGVTVLYKEKYTDFLTKI